MLLLWAAATAKIEKSQDQGVAAHAEWTATEVVLHAKLVWSPGALQVLDPPGSYLAIRSTSSQSANENPTIPHPTSTPVHPPPSFTCSNHLQSLFASPSLVKSFYSLSMRGMDSMVTSHLANGILCTRLACSSDLVLWQVENEIK